MKKLWVLLLCTLFVASLALCATAEENGITAEPLDAAVPEQEVDLTSAPSDDGLSLDASFDDFEGGCEASETFYGVISDPIYNATVGDFEITNGVLTAYNGAGGAVVIPDGVTVIADEVFNGKSSITSITFPSGLKSIGDLAFSVVQA